MSFVFQLHAIWRWGILIFAGLVALKALIGWLGKQRYTALDDRLGMVLTILLDIQVLLGLLLWFFGANPFNIRSLPQSMSNPALRFILLEHGIVYLIALVFAHIGRARTKKPGDAVAKHRSAFIFFFLSFLFILLIFIMRGMLG